MASKTIAFFSPTPYNKAIFKFLQGFKLPTYGTYPVVIYKNEDGKVHIGVLEEKRHALCDVVIEGTVDLPEDKVLLLTPDSASVLFNVATSGNCRILLGKTERLSLRYEKEDAGYKTSLKFLHGEIAGMDEFMGAYNLADLNKPTENLKTQAEITTSIDIFSSIMDMMDVNPPKEYYLPELYTTMFLYPEKGNAFYTDTKRIFLYDFATFYSHAEDEDTYIAIPLSYAKLFKRLKLASLDEEDIEVNTRLVTDKEGNKGNVVFEYMKNEEPFIRFIMSIYDVKPPNYKVITSMKTKYTLAFDRKLLLEAIGVLRNMRSRMKETIDVLIIEADKKAWEETNGQIYMHLSTTKNGENMVGDTTVQSIVNGTTMPEEKWHICLNIDYLYEILKKINNEIVHINFINEEVKPIHISGGCGDYNIYVAPIRILDE